MRAGSRARSAVVTAGVAVALVATACSGDSDGDVEAFCTLAQDQTRFETVFDDLDPTDVDAALAVFRTARARQDELLAVAPDRPEEDLQLVATFIDDLIEGLEEADPTVERPSVYDELRPRFDQVESANDRLELYVTATC